MEDFFFEKTQWKHPKAPAVSVPIPFCKRYNCHLMVKHEAFVSCFWANHLCYCFFLFFQGKKKVKLMKNRAQHLFTHGMTFLGCSVQSLDPAPWLVPRHLSWTVNQLSSDVWNSRIALEKSDQTYIWHMAVCQNLVPLVNIKIAGKWMFIPTKNGINRYWSIAIYLTCMYSSLLMFLKNPT